MKDLGSIPPLRVYIHSPKLNSFSDFPFQLDAFSSVYVNSSYNQLQSSDSATNDIFFRAAIGPIKAPNLCIRPYDDLLIFRQFLSVPLFRNVTMKCLTEIAAVTVTHYEDKFVGKEQRDI